nr:hypothetical protein Hi04_10k_c5801_00008 [uncultured bacterium]
MSSSWAAQEERSNAFALWTITWIARNLGRWTARLVLYPIVVYFVLSPRLRDHSLAYLRRVLPNEPGWMDVARHIHAFASTLLDRVFMLSGRFDALEVRVHHSEALLHCVANKRGALLLGSHLGSFEVMRCLAATEPDVRVKILMHRQKNAMVMSVLEALNPEIARAVIDTGGRDTNTVLAVKEALEEGCFVGMLGDRVYEDERTVRCHFLGGEVDFPCAPVMLASMLRVPVVLCFGLYRGGNRYDVHFEVLGENIRIERRTRETDLQQWVQRYVSRLEHYTAWRHTTGSTFSTTGTSFKSNNNEILEIP